MSHAITKTSAAAFVAQGTGDKTREVLRDGTVTGFALALSKGGTATWWFVYRMPGTGRSGKPQTITIGKWPTLAVDDARQQAKVYAGMVAAGVDPLAQRKEKAAKEKLVLDAALNEYEAHLKGRGVLKIKTMMSALRRGLDPLLEEDITTLNRKTLVERIEKVSTERGPGAAGDLRKFLNTFMARQVNLGVLTNGNPLTGLRLDRPTKADIAGDEEAARVLTDEQLVGVWTAAGRLGSPFGSLVRMGLLSGLRRGELAALRWDWIDRENTKITVPALSMKGGREHLVPVTPMMGVILDAMPRQTGPLVFPSTRSSGDIPISGWTQLVAKLRAEANLPWLGLHDLRRSFRSRLADLGVPEAVAEAMIAHKRPDLISRYTRAQMWKLRSKAALDHDKAIAALLAEAAAKQAQGNGNIVSITKGSSK